MLKLKNCTILQVFFLNFPFFFTYISIFFRTGFYKNHFLCLFVFGITSFFFTKANVSIFHTSELEESTWEVEAGGWWISESSRWLSSGQRSHTLLFPQNALSNTRTHFFFFFFFFLVTDSQMLKHRHKTSLNCSSFDPHGVIYWHAWKWCTFESSVFNRISAVRDTLKSACKQTAYGQTVCGGRPLAPWELFAFR